jgi:hypothetical protein
VRETVHYREIGEDTAQLGLLLQRLDYKCVG